MIPRARVHDDRVKVTEAAESSREPQAVGRKQTGNHENLEISKPTPSDTPLPTKPHLLILSKQFHNWEPRFQM